MKRFTLLLLFFILKSTSSYSQTGGFTILTGPVGGVSGENFCGEINVGYNTIQLPYCTNFKESFTFFFPPTSSPRNILLQTYDSNGSLVNQSGVYLPAYFTTISFLSRKSNLAINLVQVY